ncbi:ATP synthase F0 subunit C [bacterium]|nr:ATP synthase F0 subunit C [bacterium]
MDWILVAKCVGASLAVGIAAFGSAFGEGYIAMKASEAIARQPRASSEIVRTMLITQAVSETAGIFGLLISIILIFVAPSRGGITQAVSLFAAGLCMGVGAIGAGVGSGQAGGAACESIGRYPRLSANILLTTLVGQAIVQTGCIFALVVSMLLSITVPSVDTVAAMGAMLGAGCAMGFGAIGAGISTGFTAKNAIWGMSRKSSIGGVLTRTMLLGQAVAHAGAIYSLIIAFLLIFGNK